MADGHDEFDAQSELPEDYYWTRVVEQPDRVIICLGLNHLAGSVLGIVMAAAMIVYFAWPPRGQMSAGFLVLVGLAIVIAGGFLWRFVRDFARYRRLILTIIDGESASSLEKSIASADVVRLIVVTRQQNTDPDTLTQLFCTLRSGDQRLLYQHSFLKRRVFDLGERLSQRWNVPLDIRN